jgi:hypothetical protein
MTEVAPFRLTLPAAMPALDRDTLLAAIDAQAEVQISTRRDPMTVEGVLAIIKTAGDTADAITKIITLSAILYKAAREARARGMIPSITLSRPGQPELHLDQARDAEEIAAWIRRASA